MKTFCLFSVASAILILCAVAVHSASAPANTGGTETSPVGQSAAEAEREAWKKIREQTADFINHEREYIMSLAKSMNWTYPEKETVVAEKAAAAVNLAPVAAAPEGAATTLPPATTAAPTNSSSTSVGSTAEAQQPTTTPASTA